MSERAGGAGPVRHVIFNADDLGASEGINRGIIEAHLGGVITSASLMTRGLAAERAGELAREHPGLSVGLHWDVTGEDERSFDLTDERAVRQELERQLDQFTSLTGGPPTHLDSHKHTHEEGAARDVFLAVGAELGVPVRGDGQVHYIGGFYAQWEWKVTELRYVSVEFLTELLRTEVTGEWTEIGCHPGFRTAGFTSAYDGEREVEVQTLTDPRIGAAIAALDITLASYADHRATLDRLPSAGHVPQDHPASR